jgi:replication factor C subunit 1
LWTEKYRPKLYSEVIGNKSLVEKLAQWLKNWHFYHKGGFPKGELSQWRAALLSGPPGLGKTTSAHLVAKMEGFDAIEFNASDTRSKKSLEVFEYDQRTL